MELPINYFREKQEKLDEGDQLDYRVCLNYSCLLMHTWCDVNTVLVCSKEPLY